jgi:3-oxoacyl-[acyl-carrier-protein] synthase-1
MMDRRGKPLFLSVPGLKCAAGNNLDELYSAVTEGNQAGIAPLEFAAGRQFLAAHIPDRTIYQIADEALEQIRDVTEEAIKEYGRDRIAVCAGSCDNGSEESLAAHRAFFENGAFPAGYSLDGQSAGNIARYVADKFGLSGAAFTIAAACASSAVCFLRAAELIRAGFFDAAITGGADIASYAALCGFGALGAISDSVCNPFSRNRKGATLGDAACFFVLSGRDFSGRGIEFFGGGESADADHITSPKADGSGAAAAMRAALSLIPDKTIDYINLHGTGTPQNDAMEARAATMFTPPPPASSTKPVTGHTLGAAGALELAVCYSLLASDKKLLPVHCWDGVHDESLPPLPLVKKNQSADKINVCMSNSFAFGGCNVSLIIGNEN